MSRLTAQLLRAFTLPGAARMLTPLLRERATVLVLHRLKDLERGIPGSDPDAIRAALAYLRRERFEIVSLEEIVRRSVEGEPPLRGAVAFTLDDGYAEQGLRLASLFAEFDCPSTTFVTTGFLDGHLWMWWDRIEYLLRHTAERRLTVELGEREVSLSWEDDAGRGGEQARLMEACKKVDDGEKHRAIARLADAAGVELPEQPPPEYAPMSWSDLRSCERQGMRFGPHTVTHPILSRTAADAMRRELAESWDRLCAEAEHPVPVFCYPNGQPGDYGDREYAVLRELGFRAAVTGLPGYVERCNGGDGFEEYQLNRFPLSDRLANVAQYVSGFERLKDVVRGATR